MKITNYVIVFLILIMAALIYYDVSASNLAIMTNKSVQYNRNIDNALQAAVNNIVEADDGKIYTNEDKCMSDFYNSMYAAFGIKDNEAAQQIFRVYIPAVTIAENDGFYVRYNSYSKGKLKTVWSIKYPYSKEFVFSDNLGSARKFTVNYRLDDTIQLSLDNGVIFQGNKNNLSELYKYEDISVRILLDKLIDAAHLDSDHEGYYDADKDEAITESITQKMNFFANMNNNIAEAFGISYQFRLPSSASSELNRAIKDVTIIALFQGYPYGTGRDDTYSKFAVAGARIHKSNRYYVRKGAGDIYYYHTKYCEVDGAKCTGNQYRTKEDAASKGAYSCPYCKP